MTLTISQISIIVGIICSIIGAAGGFYGSQRMMKQDATGNGKEKGELMTDIKHIKDGIDELKVAQKEQDNRYVDMAIQVAKLDSACKSLHKRIDTWENQHITRYPDISE